MCSSVIVAGSLCAVPRGLGGEGELVVSRVHLAATEMKHT